MSLLANICQSRRHILGKMWLPTSTLIPKPFWSVTALLANHKHSLISGNLSPNQDKRSRGPLNQSGCEEHRSSQPIRMRGVQDLSSNQVLGWGHCYITHIYSHLCAWSKGLRDACRSYAMLAVRTCSGHANSTDAKSDAGTAPEGVMVQQTASAAITQVNLQHLKEGKEKIMLIGNDSKLKARHVSLERNRWQANK